MSTAPTAAPAQAKPKNAVDRYFGITAAGSNFPREIRAGLTTFLTMSYIIFVNPDILSAAIQIPGVDNIFTQLLTTTCIAAAFGTIIMGIVARYPFAQAPGMGLNAFFTYTVVIGMGIEWQTALGAVFISGILFVVLSAIGARQAIVHAIPMNLKLSITAGIGAFLAFVGLQNASVVVSDPNTFVTLGEFSSSTVWLFLVGLVVMAVLTKLRVKGAILIGILSASILAIITKAPVYPGSGDDALAPFGGFANGLVGAPVMPVDLVGALDIGGALSTGLISVIFTFFFVDFFDATGTLTGLANRAGYMDKNGDMPRARRTFMMDGFAAIFGAWMGTSTTTVFVESASGVEEGGRTGFTSIITGLLFILATFLWPLAAAIPSAATAPALVLVGAMMIEAVKGIEWTDIGESLPAFLTIMFMPLTYSIANGVSMGVIAYALIKLFTGKGKQVHWLLYLVAAFLLARYIFFV